MPKIKSRARVADVRQLVQHSEYDWQIFMNSSRKIAKRLIADGRTWESVRKDTRTDFLQIINEELTNIDAPLVTQEVLEWRMPKAVYELKKKPRSKRSKPGSKNKTSLLQPTVNTLAYDGLVKVRSDQIQKSDFRDQDLTIFYLQSICSGRTILKDNAYAQEVVSIALHHSVTKWAVVTLTASYCKEFLQDERSKQRMRAIEITALNKTRNLLMDKTETRFALDAANMLLIQHAILNPSLHMIHWTNYLYQLQNTPGKQATLIMAGHATWLMTILPLADKYHFQAFDYDWIGNGDEECLTRVNGILGTSRKMLHLGHRVTMAAKGVYPEGFDRLLEEIDQTPQWVGKDEKEWAAKIALDTAETYRLATKLYCLVRVYMHTPSDPIIRSISATLASKLCELPSRGKGYSSIHPAWCFVIACACTEESHEYAKMYSLLHDIGHINKSNVLDVLTLIGWIVNWKSKGKPAINWWEDMAGYLDSMMNGRLTCLS